MSAKISPDARRLIDRLRMAADEIESAARYGVPVPFCVNVDGGEYGDMSFAATEAEFDAWVEYAEAVVTHHAHDGADWSRVETNINGLPVHFAVRHAADIAGPDGTP